MKRTLAFALLAAVFGGILAGCEGEHIVKAPPTRPQNIGMARGTTANGNTPPAANNGN
ncbi:MAG: hypothetical protein JST51_06705 [Armatimonadetes bacterium]|nr:hypothetical protein [Armatimonadota bacterium]